MINKERFKPLVFSICEGLKIDPKYMVAIIDVESSSWDPYAARYEDGFHDLSKPSYWARMNVISVDTETQLQKFSYGLGQIMGGTARGLGFKEPLPRLFDPQTNIFMCATYLSQLMKKYPEGTAFISAYNAGSPSSKNQDYVQKVLSML